MLNTHHFDIKICPE